MLPRSAIVLSCIGEQAKCARPRHGLRAIGYLEFAKNMAHMVPDRIKRDHQRLRNLLVGGTTRDQEQDFVLPGAQRIQQRLG